MTTPDSSGEGPAQGQPAPVFNPEAQHHQRPRLRPVRGFPAQVNEQTVLGLADSRQISDRVVFTMPAAQLILPHFDGQKTIDEVVAAVGRGLTRPIVEQLVAQLDEAGLLFGPKFDEMLSKMRTDFDSAPNLPPASTAAFAEHVGAQEAAEGATDEDKAAAGAKKMGELFDSWISQSLEKASDPSFNELPKAIVAPHIDYPRGWINYAAVWGRMRVVDRPDRVVILGTNHFGEGTGVTGCDKGYQTPLGLCEVDGELVELLRAKLGEPFFRHRYDHEREHSIELQIPWIQHILGRDSGGKFCRVFGVLVHDPAVNNGESYDGQGIGLDPFVSAMKEALGKLPGRTLVISSADLSHVGPAFGDEKPLAGDEPEVAEARNKVFNHDRELLKLINENKPDELIAAMAWEQNPTRWCSTGNIVAAMKIVEPREVRVLNYAAAMDQEGMGMVSSMAAVMS